MNVPTEDDVKWVVRDLLGGLELVRDGADIVLNLSIRGHRHIGSVDTTEITRLENVLPETEPK